MQTQTLRTLLQVLVAWAGLTTSGLHAERILVPVGQQGKQAAIDLPSKGASQTTVRAQFGEPLSRTGPIGTPPITTWTYSDFSVYFEYNHVIHAVRKHTPVAVPAAPATAADRVAPEDISEPAPQNEN